MSVNNFEQRNTNTDTIASAINFSSIYSSIQHDYERNNISNIIMQLLHMYQPKDSINAYERVLRKGQNLLEDCDFQKKQLLLSMIPSPNNIPDDTINEVFRTTTGFIKLNLQENSNTFQNIFDIKNMDEILDSVSPKQSFSNNKNVSNFKPSLSEAFPFRGFSESEISMIPSHVKNANLSSYHLNDNSNNWLERNNKYQMSSYRQYLFNKKYCVPARINTYNKIDESHICHGISQMGYQDTHSTKTCNKTEIITNLWQNKIPQHFNVKYECKKYEDTFNKDKKSDISHMIIDVGQDTTIKQTIKNDIHKMDVCWEDQNIIINADDFLPTARDKLKMSINNFLKRVQEGIFIELSAFPRIKLHPQVSSLNMVYFTSKELKSGTPSKILEQDFISNVSNSDSCLLLKQQNTDINVEKNQKEFRRIKQKTIIYDTGSIQKKCNSQEFNKVTEPQLQQNNLDYSTEKKAIILECKKKNMEESGQGCEMIESKPDNVNSDNNFQTRSMFQLAAYKKRYYDMLLNVQRAKVAISNSLASLSGHLTVYDDPYYSNYMCQQQHLLHQQRHLMARPQFSTCPADLLGLSSVYCDQYSWARSTCKYLLLKQLRLQRQTSPLYAQNQSGWIHRYIEHVYPYSSIPNGSDETKYCIRRKNLEEIVGKLKETEYNNLNN